MRLRARPALRQRALDSHARRRVRLWRPVVTKLGQFLEDIAWTGASARRPTAIFTVNSAPRPWFSAQQVSRESSRGGRFVRLTVVAPQVAIIDADRIEPRVMVHAGSPAVRRALPLSLTFDHRVVTGGEAARFLMALKTDLERAA